MNQGIKSDKARQQETREVAANDSSLMVCLRCQGTGNEFYSMYRQCSECGGIGVVDAAVKGDNDE